MLYHVKENWPFYVVGLVGAMLLAMIAVLIFQSVAEDRACEAAGGDVVTVGHTTIFQRVGDVIVPVNVPVTECTVELEG